MKAFATEDVGHIPNGIYSIKQGPESGVYIMLKMPEHLSGEVSREEAGQAWRSR